jgi:choice-of-anchor A domain-containing protein
MKRILIPVLVFVAAMSVSTWSHATTLLGDAALYNVFVFDDMNVGSDTQGRVAVGGNFTAASYSIGTLSSPAQYSLVTGGNVVYGPGSISHGGIYSGGNVTLKNYSVAGDVVARGTVTTINGGTVAGTVQAGSSLAGPVNFTAAEIYLKGVSYDLSHGAVNGTTTVSPWHAITLSGSNAVNSFYLSGTDLANASSLTFNFASDKIGIVNVSGTSCDFSGFGFFGGGLAENILFNFYEAENLTIGSIGVRGSILAPYADITFNSGVVHGSVIAESIVGGGQFNQNLFDHEIPGGSQPVPEPATMLLFGSGLAGLAATRLRKRKSG